MRKIVGTIVNPILFILQIMFAVAAVILLGYAVVGLFVELPGVVSLFSTELTGFPRFITTVGCCVLFIVLAYLCRRTIKKIRDK